MCIIHTTSFADPKKKKKKKIIIIRVIIVWCFVYYDRPSLSVVYRAQYLRAVYSVRADLIRFRIGTTSGHSVTYLKSVRASDEKYRKFGPDKRSDRRRINDKSENNRDGDKRKHKPKTLTISVKR